ncbi:molybdopterin-dependent oxidoreductase [Paenibacillus hexagrammi]|uniref:Molybdopterin-dependent oxidoreductase n=1 Tax=Paenibacillus hexagrammi TaxID=2908839 RepID=A0ABY3SLE4_9BACL|nr:molybdopterin-dependent oxidoreductase [Paenibacillus sp. YPD9-1]UJF34698.1 molybdopterin-dependent oxidoreductase [Paenibacillus sp. YPD9-1]
MNKQAHIQVMDQHRGSSEIVTVHQMAETAPWKLSLAERVPEVKGEGFDLKSWYRHWRDSRSTVETQEEPTHLKVEAVDEFQALIPWAELDQALILYAQNGEPLQKGFPIRLYVPNGSSECLNVKSVIKISFLYDQNLGNEATYGYKNAVTVEEMKFKK